MTIIQKHLLRILFIIIWLATSTITGYTQDFYYSNDSCKMELVNDAGITTSTEVLTISWTPSFSFVAPYEVVHLSTSDTLAHYGTNISTIIIKVSGEKHSQIEIVDAIGRIKTIPILYKRAYNWTMIWKIVALVLFLFLAYIICKKGPSKITEQEKRVSIKTAHGSKKYECATVLFADIQGFTKIAERLNQDQLIDELDRYFIYFDELVEQFSVEKIKTIGDAYMCAGGVPESDSANPIEVTLVGLGMIAYVKQRQATENGFWNIRVGINTGAVVSGLLGNKKRVFDIWGDSVNLASRMESSGMPGEVNVSGDTYMRINDYFECEHRGRMPVKYKGEVDMYFIKRLKPEYAENGSTYKPNDKLKRKMQRLKTADLEASIRDILFDVPDKTEENLFDIFSVRVDTLALSEKLDDEQYIICKVAGLLSYINMHFSKEYKGILANVSSSLRRMRLAEEQIESISKISDHTASMRLPSTIIEKIITDAHNERFGRKDFIAIEMDMERALTQKNKRKFKRKVWIKEEMNALNSIKYYTESARNLVEVNKEEQIRVINQIIHLI